MAKYYGNIGFSQIIETSPGVWKEDIISKFYTGDIIRNTQKQRNMDSINTNLTVTSDISIIADNFANENIQNIKWVELYNYKWCVDSIDVLQYPRMTLSLGGVYNE